MYSSACCSGKPSGILHQQQGDVRLTFPQRREMDGDDVDAVVEVADAWPLLVTRIKEDLFVAHVMRTSVGGSGTYRGRKTPCSMARRRRGAASPPAHGADFSQFLKGKAAPPSAN